MKDQKEMQARETMAQIHGILWHDWDPIGVKKMGGPENEYDSYIGGVYHLLLSGATVEAIVNHLSSIETGSMGMSPVEKKKLEPIAEKLLKLDVSPGPV